MSGIEIGKKIVDKVILSSGASITNNNNRVAVTLSFAKNMNVVKRSRAVTKEVNKSIFGKKFSMWS